ncbi:MAG: 2-oxoacid:acceptor oxidoreductase family protein [Thermodesulfobacteriota bacterium]
MAADSHEIRLGGLGGQGVILAGVLLGQAAVNQGLFAAGSNSYGAQARGSTCQAEVVVAAGAIDYPHVEAADLLVAMSQGAYDAYRSQMAPDGVILYDSSLVTPDGEGRQFGLAVTETAVSELNNKQVANVVWVGVAAGFTGWFDQQALERAVADNVPARFLELNRRALARGLQMGRELRG